MLHGISQFETPCDSLHLIEAMADIRGVHTRYLKHMNADTVNASRAAMKGMMIFIITRFRVANSLWKYPLHILSAVLAHLEVHFTIGSFRELTAELDDHCMYQLASFMMKQYIRCPPGMRIEETLTFRKKLQEKWNLMNCVNCGKHQKLKTCRGCMKEAYCCRKCQKSHWNKEHRLECTRIWNNSVLWSVLRDFAGSFK